MAGWLITRQRGLSAAEGPGYSCSLIMPQRPLQALPTPDPLCPPAAPCRATVGSRVVSSTTAGMSAAGKGFAKGFARGTGAHCRSTLALLTPHAIAHQSIEAGGDYVGWVKDTQPSDGGRCVRCLDELSMRTRH
jgi:hypothetical protein